MHTMRGRVGAVLWTLCVQFFVAEQFVSRTWTLPYSFARNYVSDLGAVGCGLHDDLLVCSPGHAWMNASFVLQGLLIFGGALLVRRFFAPWLGYSVGLALMEVSGLGVLIVGIAPEDVYGAVHYWGAAAHFAGGGVAIIVLGVMLARDGRRSPLGGWLSVALGVAVLLSTGLLGLRGTAFWHELGWPVGIVERVAAYGVPGWVVVMGAVLFFVGDPSTSSE